MSLTKPSNRRGVTQKNTFLGFRVSGRQEGLQKVATKKAGFWKTLRGSRGKLSTFEKTEKWAAESW